MDYFVYITRETISLRKQHEPQKCTCKVYFLNITTLSSLFDKGLRKKDLQIWVLQNLYICSAKFVYHILLPSTIGIMNPW